MGHCSHAARTAVLICLMWASASLLAQEAHHYKATLSAGGAPIPQKQLRQRLEDAAPLGLFHLDPGTGEFELKTLLELDHFRLQFMLTEFNMHVLRFEDLAPAAARDTAAPRQTRLADMPLYMDTGDRVRDDQRYEAYKSAWIAAHPEEYKELTAPMPAPTTRSAD